jgi:hypothetical protein
MQYPLLFSLFIFFYRQAVLDYLCVILFHLLQLQSCYLLHLGLLLVLPLVFYLLHCEY